MAPHAVSAPASAQQQPNGVTHIKTITHLQSFPLVSSLTSTVNSIPLAKRTLSLIQTIVSPLTPYASPYITKADSIADSNLTKIEVNFPIVKESPENLKTIIVSYPYKLIDTGKAYVTDSKAYALKIYTSELEKAGQSTGLLPQAKASVSSAFIISNEVLTVVAQFLGAKKVELEKKGQEKREYASAKYSKHKKERSSHA
ncbi:hypothetical protein EX30DRAFT_340611 [Ascodesmis nigricans]|uniref:Uncharacterized protein n=1 Tax=Ascodesmis nigricans TaxID=341454 RepID=A0A4S2MYH3_9PEZI|nr:hypothetical protein EX30DRAFT_340611 [Ascodesmis nigricans]